MVISILLVRAFAFGLAVLFANPPYFVITIADLTQLLNFTFYVYIAYRLASAYTYLAYISEESKHNYQQEQKLIIIFCYGINIGLLALYVIPHAVWYFMLSESDASPEVKYITTSWIFAVIWMAGFTLIAIFSRLLRKQLRSLADFMGSSPETTSLDMITMIIALSTFLKLALEAVKIILWYSTHRDISDIIDDIDESWRVNGISSVSVAARLLFAFTLQILPLYGILYYLKENKADTAAKNERVLLED